VKLHSFAQCLRAVPSVLLIVTAAACSGSNNQVSAAAENSARNMPVVRHDEHVFAGGRVAPGAAIRNPFNGDAKAAKTGAKLFSAMNCDGCHGVGATGWVGPSLSARRWRFGGSDADIFQTIYYGRPHGMPAFGGLISTDGIWQIEAYIRTLPLPGDVPTEAW
jgi:cytochrome c oxidase cbb3-type subunit 3